MTDWLTNIRGLAQQQFTFTLPSSLPSGQYLARVEQVRDHFFSQPLASYLIRLPSTPLQAMAVPSSISDVPKSTLSMAVAETPVHSYQSLVFILA